jgi:hypothetical protein
MLDAFSGLELGVDLCCGSGLRGSALMVTPRLTEAERMRVVIVTHRLLRQGLMKQSVYQWKQGPVDLCPKDSCYALSLYVEMRVSENAGQIVKVCAVLLLFGQSVSASLFVRRRPCWRVCCVRSEDKLQDG